MNYTVRMVDIPSGSNPIVELPDDAIIVGPWQNTGASRVGIIYLFPVGLPPEEARAGEETEEKVEERP